MSGCKCDIGFLHVYMYMYMHLALVMYMYYNVIHVYAMYATSSRLITVLCVILCAGYD